MKDTLNLTLICELCGICCEYFGENLWSYDEITLCLAINSSDAGDEYPDYWGSIWRLLTPKVARASAGMVLAEYDRQHV